MQLSRWIPRALLLAIPAIILTGCTDEKIVYRDREAFTAHTQAPHFLAWKDQVESLLVAEPQIQELSTCVPLDEAWTPQEPLGQNGGADTG